MKRILPLLSLCIMCGCVAPEDVPLPLPTAWNPPGTAFDTLPRGEVAQVTLAWNPSSGATGYNVYVNGIKQGSTTNVQLTFVSPSGRFTNEVTAYNASGESAKSIPLIWPPIPTNIITIASVYVTNLSQITGVTNWSISLTNPTDTRFYRHDIKIDVLQ